MENVRLLTGDTLAAACSRLQCHEAIALFLYHLAGDDGVEEAARLLETVVAAKRPVATIILCEHYRAEQALALLRLGAAECLAPPFDLSRLGFLIDVLTVRARLAVSDSKSEIRNPKSEIRNSHVQVPAFSDQGGSQFGFRISDFGFRISPSDPIQALGEANPFLYDGGAG